MESGENVEQSLFDTCIKEMKLLMIRDTFYRFMLTETNRVGDNRRGKKK